MAKPERTLPAFLPATLVPLYLRDPRKDVSIHRRQIALLGASLREKFSAHLFSPVLTGEGRAQRAEGQVPLRRFAPPPP